VIKIYTQLAQAEQWLQRYRGCLPQFVCVLGFTETALIPGISAAGATPEDRQYTAIADAEFLSNGVQPHPQYRLPHLPSGLSPTFITRAIIASQAIPCQLFDAGLPLPATVPTIDLGGRSARCLSGGNALDLPVVEHLFQQGLRWGTRLAAQVPKRYLILGECVVGGTTTALSVLMGLGFEALGQVSSSHPICNHSQKAAIVQAGLAKLPQGRRGAVAAGSAGGEDGGELLREPFLLAAEPLQLVAAIGDPMQIVVAGMAIAASRTCGVLLAGGTQMLAVYALTRAIAQTTALPWQPEQIVVGTTRWVTEDATGDAVGLARAIGDVPLIATELCFANSRYPGLRAYEQGYVKEGAGAGGCAIGAHLYQNWDQTKMLDAIEHLAGRYESVMRGSYLT
jgi:NaMN:DMB phosphoribosyltransferase